MIGRGGAWIHPSSLPLSRQGNSIVLDGGCALLVLSLVVRRDELIFSYYLLFLCSASIPLEGTVTAFFLPNAIGNQAGVNLVKVFHFNPPEKENTKSGIPKEHKWVV